MKKNHYELISGVCKIWKSKFFKRMRIVTLLILISITQTLALDAYAQNKRLSVSAKNKTIVNILEKIEDQTEFYFMYDATMVDVNQRKSVNCENQPIKDILDQLFENTGIVYSVNNRQILLSTTEKPGIQQQKNISGLVTDDTGQPLPGVTVLVKGTTDGTVTNANGEYSIPNVTGGSILVFSFVGMLTQEIEVGDQSSINVSLEADAIGIEEVVAIGYGTMKKANLTGAVENIDSEELTKRPVASVAQLMQGKLAGVNIFSATGQPGNEETNISIRGTNSFGSGNSPIVLIDGVEGNLNDLDPDNVESISVLKDASSAAIYGARAANGVILVTTKMGKAGEFSVQYHGNFAMHQASLLPDLINDPVEHMELFNIANVNSNTGISFPDDIIQKYKSGEYKSFNWDNAMLLKPFVHKHNLAITGGSDKIRFNFALGYWDQTGVVIGSDFKKYNARFSVDADINKYIAFGANVGAVHSTRRGYDAEAGSAAIMQEYYLVNPTYGPKLEDGRYTMQAFPAIQRAWNPIIKAEQGGVRESVYNFNGKVFLNIKPFKGFTWSTTGALKYDHDYVKLLNNPVATYDYITGELASPQGEISLNVGQPFETLYTLFSTVEYVNSIKNTHNFKVLAGYSQESFKNNKLTGFRKGIPIASLAEISAAGPSGQNTTGTSFEWALQSFFGRLNYDYKGKYLAEVNFRYDGSSRFHRDSRWGLFPSFSAGWRISEEDFLKNNNWLSNLKLRGSWGELGNQLIGNYPYQTVLELGNDYPFNNTIAGGAAASRLSNQNITWETTRITDIGVDLMIKNGLFGLTFDYFNKTTTDILREAQVMKYVGLDAPTVNSGEMKNFGFDMVASHRNKVGEFSYNVDVTFSRIRNEVTKFGEQEISDQTIIKEGEPLNSWYLLEFDGIFQSEQDIANSPIHPYTPKPGHIKLKDTDGDGDVDADDRVLIDGQFPKFTYGVNLNMEWKNFDLSVFIQGVEGIKKYVRWWGIQPFYTGPGRLMTKWRDAWTPQNKSNTLPILNISTAEPSMNYASSFYLQDASYVRLKNLQIGYNIPSAALKNYGIQALRIYFSGDNLLTITDYEGADPERGDGYYTWRNFAVYPQVKIYSLGVKVKF